MDIFALAVALFAVAGVFIVVSVGLLWREQMLSHISSLAKEVAELKKTQEEDRLEARNAGALWEEGINNMMAFNPKNYGLNTDFLTTDGDSE